MKFKKMLCTLAAVALANMAFAGNTSELKVLIIQFFTPMEQAAQIAGDDLSAEEQQMLQTLKALKAGLLNYEQRLTTNTMNDTDKAIDTTLKTTIPGIFNKITTSSDEVAEEIEPVLVQLADKVLSNQTQFNKTQLNAEAAQGTMMLFAYVKAESDGVLLGRVSRVLQNELVQMMQGGMLQE